MTATTAQFEVVSAKIHHFFGLAFLGVLTGATVGFIGTLLQ